jgi:translation initiation factor 5
MPVMTPKIEGRGNGIKTVIPNMDEVAKALSRLPTCELSVESKARQRTKLADTPPASVADPTKFFGIELGAQTTMANDRYIVNGAHQADRLRELLDVFIEKFVLCPSCKNPETVLLVNEKKEEITRDCKACGAQTMLDMRHKLTTYILKNPPAGSTGKKGKKGSKGAADAGAPKKDKYAEAEELREAQLAGTNLPTIGGGTASPANGNGAVAEEDDDDVAKGFNNPAVANRKLNDDDWAVDTSAEAVAARMKNLAVNVDGFAGGLGDEDDDAEGAGDTKYTAFGAWIEENKEDATDAEIAAKAKEMEVWGKHKACIELGQKLWRDDLVKDVEKRVKILGVVSPASARALSLSESRLIVLAHVARTDDH